MERGWEEQIDNIEAAREVEKVLDFEVEVSPKEKWIHAVVVVVFNTEKCWDWVVNTTREHFNGIYIH